MKIDGAAVPGRGGFETRPCPGAVGRNRLFHRLYVAFARPWCFPRRACPVPRYGAGIHVPGLWIPAQGRDDEGPPPFILLCGLRKAIVIPNAAEHSSESTDPRSQDEVRGRREDALDSSAALCALGMTERHGALQPKHRTVITGEHRNPPPWPLDSGSGAGMTRGPAPRPRLLRRSGTPSMPLVIAMKIGR